MTVSVAQRQGRWDARSVAIVVAAVLLVVAALGYPVWHPLSARRELQLVDLDVYRSAGTSMLIGRPVYSYLTDAPQLLPFTYPPIAAIFAIPLALIPWSAVIWVWTVIQLVFLGVITAIAFRPLLRRFRHLWPVALALLIGAAGWLLPIRDGIRFGQVDIVLVALCLLDCVVARPRWPRGLLIGIAAAVKLTPAVFVPYLWLTGRRRAAIVAAASAAALAVAAALISPAASRDYWGGALFDSSRLGTNSVTSNQSLRGMLLRTPLPGSARSLVLLVCVVAVLVVGYARARRLSMSGDEVAAVAVVGLIAVAVSPVSWIHHLAWVVLALGVVASDLSTRRQAIAAVLVGAFYGFPLPWTGAHLLKTHWPLVLGVPLRDAYGLGALVLIATLRPRRSDQSEPDLVGQQTTYAPVISPTVALHSAVGE